MTRPSIHLPTETWVALYPLLQSQAGYPAIPSGTSITIHVTEGARARYFIGATPPQNVWDAKAFADRLDLVDPENEVWIRAAQETEYVIVEELSPTAVLTIPSKSVSPIMPSDIAKRSARNTATQEALVAVREDRFNIQFQYNVPYQDYENTEVRGATSGGGSITHAGASAVVGMDGTVGNSYLTSRDAIRYFPGHEFYAEMTIRGVTSAAENDQGRILWGVGNPGRTGDGMFYTLEPALGIVYRNNGVETPVPRSAWSNDKLDGTGPSGLNIETDKVSLWTVSGGWYGILPLVWGVFAQGYGYVVTHVYDPSNTLVDPHLGNPNLPALVECDRLSGTGDPFFLETSSIRGGVSGPVPKTPVADRAVPLRTPSVVAVTANTNTPLISIRNPTTFQSKPNTIRTRIDYLSITVSGVKPASVAIHRLGAVTGGVWTSPTPNTSPIEVNYTATAFTPDVNPTTGENLVELFGFDLKKEDSGSESLKQLEIPVAVYPGEILTVVVNSSGATEVTARVQAVSEF